MEQKVSKTASFNSELLYTHHDRPTVQKCSAKHRKHCDKQKDALSFQHWCDSGPLLGVQLHLLLWGTCPLWAVCPSEFKMHQLCMYMCVYVCAGAFKWWWCVCVSRWGGLAPFVVGGRERPRPRERDREKEGKKPVQGCQSYFHNKLLYQSETKSRNDIQRHSILNMYV